MRATPLSPVLFCLIAGLFPLTQGHTEEPVSNNSKLAAMVEHPQVSSPAIPPQPSAKNHFAQLPLEAVGIRFATNKGDDLKSDLLLYDVFAAYRLPWNRPLSKWLNLNTRVTTSIGVLDGTDDATIYGSFAPGISLTDKTQRVFLELAAGVAVVPNYTLGPEDFGGPVQFTLDAGLSYRFHKNISFGYRYYHFSDAGMYGSDNRGVDMHMIELTNRFLSQ